MKKTCLLYHHHNCFVPHHALGHMMYSFMLLVPMNRKVPNKPSNCWKAHCTQSFHDGDIYIYIYTIYNIYILYIYAYIYIYIYIYICIYIYNLASVRNGHSVCRGLLMTFFITLLPWVLEHSLVNWYQQCLNVHHAPK